MKISKTGYTRRSVNNQKVHKLLPVLEGNLSFKNAPKLSAKYLQDMQNQRNAKHSINSEDIFKSIKNVLEKRNTQGDFSNTTSSKFLSKICNRKDLHGNNTTFPWPKVFLEVPVAWWGPKFLRKENFKIPIQLFHD